MKTSYLFGRRLGRFAALAGAALAVSSSLAAGELQPPFRVEAGGQPIDTDVGHAVPIMADFDGDGVPDLLVGQFGQGRLRIYRNEGTAALPKFRALGWFRAEGAFGEVPAG
jgi:hypothetical protein